MKKKKTKTKIIKEKKEGDEEEENKLLIDFPEYEDPDLNTPIAKLKIILATPVAMKLSFTVEVLVSTRLETIRLLIIDRHDGAISNVRMCLNEYI